MPCPLADLAENVGNAGQHWFKITRVGSTISGYVSPDGRQWKLHGKA